MINDNPASRLLAMLTEGKTISPNCIAKDAWKQILKVDDDLPENESLLMAKLGKFMLLPHETQRLVDQYYPQQSQALIHSMNPIQTALTQQNLSSNWLSFIQHIDNHSLSTLSMTAALLDHKLNTKLIENETLNELKVKVQSVFDETLHSDLPHEFKKFMTHYLQKIIHAINDYFISGAMPILDALEATLGHAVLDPEFKSSLKNSDTGTKIRSVLGDLANVVTVAAAASGAATYLIENGVPLLS